MTWLKLYKSKLWVLYLIFFPHIVDINAKILARNEDENYQVHPNQNKYYWNKVTIMSCPNGFVTDYTALVTVCPLTICPNRCPEHSTCTGPNTCECDTGYKIKSSQCQPVCHGCNHGFCYKPGHCICDPGYRLNSEHTCVPVCQDDCVNGNCVVPDVCECLHGYRLTRVIKDYCEPNCRPGCYNTDCLQPEFCLCPHANDSQKNERRAISTPTDQLKCVRADDGHE